MRRVRWGVLTAARTCSCGPLSVVLLCGFWYSSVLGCGVDVHRIGLQLLLEKLLARGAGLAG